MSGGATFSVHFSKLYNRPERLFVPWGKVHAVRTDLSLQGDLLVHFSKVHAVSKLQPGNLLCVVLNFQVRRH